MFLGIDCGTQGTKALLVDGNGVALGRGYAPHQLIERSNGAREQEPQWWVDALITAVKQALSATNRHDVLAIGVSGQQHGLVVLDEDMQVIRPAKLWNDTETAPQNAELVKRFGGPDACIECLGILPLTGYTASKLLWLKEHEPENFARVRHILLPHEYLNFWLTGQLCAEYGDASGTGYFNPRTRTWMKQVLDAIDGGTGQLAAALPRLIGPDEVVDILRPQVAQEFGITGECIVSPGGGDNMMGAIGTGNVREGIVTLSLGTSSTLYSFRSTSQKLNASVAPFCSSTGGWLPLVCTMNATNVVTQTLHLLGMNFADMETAMEKTSPGADGLTFVPFLNGERTPDLPGAYGSLVGITANNYTRENLMRAAVEGVSFGILSGLDLILQGEKPTIIHVIGGGSRSHAWRQLLADATGAEIHVPLESEAGCLGAVIQAMYVYALRNGQAESYSALVDRMVRVDTKQTAQPRAELHEVYQHAIQAYRSQVKRLYFA